MDFQSKGVECAKQELLSDFVLDTVMGDDKQYPA